MTTNTMAERARITWSMRLSSAIRTSAACAIVGGASLYGPKLLTHEIKFVAFSYLTAVMIVSDSTLGASVRGCWHALGATVQVVPLAMLVRWLLTPTDGVPVGVAAAVTAAAAFLVALPEWSHITTKRIAFGQIVLVCTNIAVDGTTKGGFKRPSYLAASTALGAVAPLVALLLPYPGLACHKVRKLCQVYAENVSQRMNIYLRAFTAKDKLTKMELISQAKPLSETGAKLLESITILQEGMQWERPWSRVPGPGRRLERMELHMRRIQYSLVSSPPFPIREIDEEKLSDFLQSISNRVKVKIEQVCSFSSPHSITESETSELMASSLPTFPLPKQEWVFFYLSCIDKFLNDTFAASKELKTRQKFSIIRPFKTWIQRFTFKRFEFAFKCSLALSLAVLFGLIFNKEQGCWAGLTIAISFSTERQAIFTIANTRAQGTAIGSAYGVICCFLFHDEEIRLLALLPWIVITSLLRHSKMYGQTGGVSAAIGALLILGRKNYGTPNEFAIARLTEVFIGLSAFILVEIFLQPIRAATLAKNHLFVNLQALQDCIKETYIWPLQKIQTIPPFLELTEMQRNLSSHVCELKKIVGDAEVEPDFWYLPFRTSCYQKLVQALSNMTDLLYSITYNFGTITTLLETADISMEFREQILNELLLFQEILGSSQIYPQKATSSELQADIHDLEAGILRNAEKLTVFVTKRIEEEETREGEDTGDKTKLREMLIQCLNATGFCVSSLMKELQHIRIHLQEIDQWSNQSDQ